MAEEHAAPPPEAPFFVGPSLIDWDSLYPQPPLETGPEPQAQVPLRTSGISAANPGAATMATATASMEAASPSLAWDSASRTDMERIDSTSSVNTISTVWTAPSSQTSNTTFPDAPWLDSFSLQPSWDLGFGQVPGDQGFSFSNLGYLSDQNLLEASSHMLAAARAQHTAYTPSSLGSPPFTAAPGMISGPSPASPLNNRINVPAIYKFLAAHQEEQRLRTPRLVQDVPVGFNEENPSWAMVSSQALPAEFLLQTTAAETTGPPAQASRPGLGSGMGRPRLRPIAMALTTPMRPENTVMTSFAGPGRTPTRPRFPRPFACGHQGCRTRPFKRQHDRERHMQTHEQQGRGRFACDYLWCDRSAEKYHLFTRLDHLRVHYRDCHMEDLPKRGRAGRVTAGGDSDPAKANGGDGEDAEWWRTRVLGGGWFRCTKCLRRVSGRRGDWTCICGTACESERVRARQAHVAGARAVSAGVGAQRDDKTDKAADQ